ncbi:PDZ domain-containing protein [Frigoriglobus tundricola]|uniref:PDZ domain-containing protein n=1 Tax=Frigoriglobus tundricola TaxID=2774151 RepID=A0A6M5YZR2_9BACT|nr:PDZ domain-containing protein [Frigoriglobus tundricola]QJW98910.1 hypothetical protein FTUN_6505 [Frigoriglobus tundricola]
MTAITAFLLGGLTVPALAPVPPSALPDPMARGYMGVTIGDGVVVSRVEPKTPAEQAGLRSGDVILRVGTLHPESYEQVVAHICSFRPGAVVEVEVQRGSEKKTVRVKLTCRPPELDQPYRYSSPIPIDD